MGGIQNIIKFSDCRDFYVFLLLIIADVSISSGLEKERCKAVI
jgi:hypothetical protein